YVETESFNPKYRNIKWENDEKLFKKWKSGETGFPLVDAGMRELVQTGRMHNRVRMVVASFLVKDLHIDWRWGERFFMEHLLDGDLAANNGGWQWAASTGCDPQPYFRIFNPQSQAKKFDPENSYIQKWVPEFGTKNELRPIVNHAERARRAVTLYRKLG
ncbi:MAG TPA: FAD-binding domain-containing protein, partial [Oligoflexia bacterium]|nr:FAD-binding domain-containing protein [Oligoflexia bacterium]